jgi:hypothetical protein
MAPLILLASDFRRAIERCPRGKLPKSFKRFPHGSCGDSTLLLAKYLERNGHSAFSYIHGMRGDHSHAWLQRDDLVIDITADQFVDQEQPVIVAYKSEWHLTFNTDLKDEQPTDFEQYDQLKARMLTRAYHAIIQNVGL